MSPLNIIRTFYRNFAFFIFYFSLLEGFFFNDKKGILLAIISGLATLFNHFIKNVSKLIFGSLGIRPTGASGCGYGASSKLSTSYGMPSGHSQEAALIGTLVILALETKNVWYYVKILLLCIFILGAMTMRVIFEKCHTWLQVIIGASFGVALAFGINHFVNPFKTLENKE